MMFKHRTEGALIYDNKKPIEISGKHKRSDCFYFWFIYLCCRKRRLHTGLFISPSGISELDCATTKTDTEERSISIGRESLQVFLY